MKLTQASELLHASGKKHVLVSAYDLASKELLSAIHEVEAGYLEAALFSTTYSGEDPDINVDEDSDKAFRDLGYQTSDCSKKFKDQAIKDIKAFLSLVNTSSVAVADLEDFMAKHRRHAAEFGVNFWYSRNGHSVGFFDTNNNALQRLAKTFGEVNLYANKSGKIESN
jgi:hypothetical protein